MKRKLALTVALVLTFGLLAGCGGGKQGDQGNQGSQAPGSGSQQPAAPTGGDTLVV